MYRKAVNLARNFTLLGWEGEGKGGDKGDTVNIKRGLHISMV